MLFRLFSVLLLLALCKLAHAQASPELQASYALRIDGEAYTVDKADAHYRPAPGDYGGAHSLQIALMGQQPEAFKFLLTATVPNHSDTGTLFLPCNMQIPFESDSLFATATYLAGLAGEEAWNAEWTVEWSTRDCPPNLQPIGFNRIRMATTGEAMVVGANGIAVKANLYRIRGRFHFWVTERNDFVEGTIDLQNLSF